MAVKILVVDDQPGIRDLLLTFFELEGFEVSTVAGGRQAIERVEQEPPDLVIMDIKMPGMTGLDALREIRKNNSRLAVIMMTACGSEKEFEVMRELRVGRFIAKPFDLMVLKAAVTELLCLSVKAG